MQKLRLGKTRPRPHAILLDMDGTLVDTGPCEAAAKRAVTAALANYLPGVPLEFLAKTYAEISERVWHEVVNSPPAPGYSYDSRPVVARICREVVARAGLQQFSAEQALAESFLAAYRSAQPLPFADALRLLDQLRGAFKFVVVTNGRADIQHSMLEKAGILSRVHAVVTPDGVGVGKPAREIFRAALDAAGASANQAVHVGDGLFNDVYGARNAGIRAVWLNRNGAIQDGRWARPDAEIRSLGELPPLLA